MGLCVCVCVVEVCVYMHAPLFIINIPDFSALYLASWPLAYDQDLFLILAWVSHDIFCCMEFFICQENWITNRNTGCRCRTWSLSHKLRLLNVSSILQCLKLFPAVKNEYHYLPHKGYFTIPNYVGQIHYEVNILSPTCINQKLEIN